MPTPDPLALLDTLDGLHKDAPEQLRAELDVFNPDEREIEAVILDKGVTVLFTEGTGSFLPADGATKADRDARWDEARRSRALAYAKALAETHNAYPHLAQALRTALTPTTDGEREAREALFFADRDHAAGFRCVPEPIHRALSTALNLLAAERAKAADAARERAAIVADLREAARGIRSAPGSAVLLLVNGAVADAFVSAADRYESGAHTKVTP